MSRGITEETNRKYTATVTIEVNVDDLDKLDDFVDDLQKLDRNKDYDIYINSEQEN